MLKFLGFSFDTNAVIIEWFIEERKTESRFIKNENV